MQKKSTHATTVYHIVSETTFNLSVPVLVYGGLLTNQRST